MAQSVDDFLQECCLLIDRRLVDPFTNDKDNKATLNLLGYSIKALLEELKDLESKDLFRGPNPDRSSKHPGDVWEFKKVIQGHLIYIKLKIRIFDSGKRKDLFVMSFHPDRP